MFSKILQFILGRFVCYCCLHCLFPRVLAPNIGLYPIQKSLASAAEWALESVYPVMSY